MAETQDNHSIHSRLSQIETILKQTVEQVNSLVERVTLLEDNRPSYGSSDFGEQQASMMETFSQIKEINDSLAASRSLFYQTQQGLDKTNISLQENNTSLDTLKAALEAAKERQERMLDYIRQKIEEENA